MGITYKDSGVDVEGANAFVKKIGPIVKSTFTDKVISDIGSFGALYSASFPQLKDPVLVSGTDGVGTKIEIAKSMNVHNTIGIDAVAMCVNDILALGAKPLFFLDYISCGKLNESILVEIVKGIAEGCQIADCSLIGGETAEHPNVMAPDEYDIAGFSVGVVDRDKIISGSNIRQGDIIIGLSSSGIHSNGYSLVRKLFFDIKKYDLNTNISDLSQSLGHVLLTPTKIYCNNVLTCIESGITIKGIIHITGGGFYENIPRILPDNTAASIEKSSYEIDPIFRLIQKEGEITEKEMYSTFNMGIGMMLVVDKNEESKTLDNLRASGEEATVIGEIEEYRENKVVLK